MTSLSLPSIIFRSSASITESALRPPQISFGGHVGRVRASPVHDDLYPAVRAVLLTEMLIEHRFVRTNHDEPAGEHRRMVGHYSITSSARASTEAGMVRPRAFAVLRLMTSSSFVGCSTGKSAGLAPLRILSM